MKRNLGYLWKRCKRVVLRVPFFKKDSDQGREDYFRHFIMLYKPWRDEELDLLGDFGSYQEAFESLYAEMSEKMEVEGSSEVFRLIRTKRESDKADLIIQKLREEVAEAERNEAQESVAEGLIEEEGNVLVGLCLCFMCGCVCGS